jgi:hypothetical protein
MTDPRATVVPERSASLLVGLRAWLLDPCRCGRVFVAIEPGRGPDHAALRCACGWHRGWISGETHKILCDVVRRFGRPTSPIEIRAPTARITAPQMTQHPKT